MTSALLAAALIVGLLSGTVLAIVRGKSYRREHEGADLVLVILGLVIIALTFTDSAWVPFRLSDQDGTDDDVQPGDA